MSVVVPNRNRKSRDTGYMRYSSKYIAFISIVLTLITLPFDLLISPLTAQTLPTVMPHPPANLNQPQARAWSCAKLAQATKSVEIFAKCTGGDVILNRNGLMLMECAGLAKDEDAFGGCLASNVLSGQLNERQKLLIKCVLDAKGDTSAFPLCTGVYISGSPLTRDEEQVVECAAKSQDNEEIVGCAGGKLLGRNLSEDQKALIECVATSHDDVSSFASCSLSKLQVLSLNNKLNEEQQIALQCVVTSGGQPYAAAACVASRLTLRELEKCVTQGIGHNGCFGDNNELVGQNGWVARTFKNVLNDVRRGPGPTNDLFGGPGFTGKALETIRHNAPPPMTVGSVGGMRICVPWC